MAQVGISLGGPFTSTLIAGTDAGAAVFARMISAGVTAVRVDATYTTGAVRSDPVIRAAAGAGLAVHLVAVGYDPATVTTAEFAAFAARIATTYQPSSLEVLNEPNLGRNWSPSHPSVDAAGYAGLIRAVYPAVKTVAPSVPVLVGGLGVTGEPGTVTATAVNPVTFLQQVYAALGGSSAGAFDGVALHPYCYPVLPGYSATWSGWQQMEATTPSVRSVMAANGDTGKRCWLTEFGAPSASGDGIDADPQPSTFPAGTVQFQARSVAACLSLAARLAWLEGPVFLFNWQDNADGAFGLFDVAGNPKLALAAAQAVLT